MATTPKSKPTLTDAQLRRALGLESKAPAADVTAALTAYQRAAGLTVTGEADPDTVEALHR